MLRIYLFRHLQADDGEVTLPTPTPAKVADLWVYLLLHRDRPTPRDRLAFELWPDVPETEARANLRRHLHLLRRHLPKADRDRPWLVSDRNTLQWNTKASYWLDVEAFQRLLAEAESGEVIIRLQSAIDLYRGDLLPNDHSEWVLLERERLRGRFTRAAEQLVALQEETGDVQAALATAQRLLARDRLREATHRLVMRLYYLTCDRAAALRQFETCQRLLREELDVELMPETLAIRQAILKGPPAGAIPQTISISTPQPTSVPISVPVPEVRESPASVGVHAEHERVTTVTPKLWRSKRLVIGGALVLLIPILVLLAILVSRGTFSPAPTWPSRTVTLSGPNVAVDTWITAEYPEIDYWPEGREWGTYDTYIQVHLQYYEQSLDRFLIRFDPETLPSDIEVREAILRIHLEAWTAEVDSGRNVLSRAYPATISAYQVYRPWSVPGTTYVYPWSEPGLAPGIDFRAAPLESQVITDTTWLQLDVTEAVGTWLVRPEENQGLMLEISEAPEDFAHYWIYTTNSMDGGLRPKLDITYTPPEGSDEQVLTLTGDRVTDTGIHSTLRQYSVDDQAPYIRLDKGEVYAKALLYFDLDKLPQETQITAAELVIYLEPGPSSGAEPAIDLPATIAVHQLFTAWEPDTVTFDYPWSEPGLSPDMDYDSTPLDTRFIKGAAYLTFDVMAAVRAWQDGGNHGLLVITHEAQEGYAPYQMRTSEFLEPAFHPQLMIYYHQD